MQQSQQAQAQEQRTQQWPVNAENMMWEPNIGGKPAAMDQHDVVQQQQYGQPEHSGDIGDQYSQANRVELNSRIKTMILNKQQNDRKLEEEQQPQHDSENKTGHFLWYSHHHRPPDLLGDGGGVPFLFRNQNTPTNLTDKSRQENCGDAIAKLLPQKNYENAEYHQKSNQEHCTRDIEKIREETSKVNNGVLPNDTKKLLNNHPMGNHPIQNQKQHSFKIPSVPYYETNSSNNEGLPISPEHMQLNLQKQESAQSKNHQITNHDRLPNGAVIGTTQQQSNQKLELKGENQKPHSLPIANETLNGAPHNANTLNHSKILGSEAIGSPMGKAGSNSESPKQNHFNEELKSKVTGTEIPFCSCFPPDKLPPEPGSYYTHLGTYHFLWIFDGTI